MDPLTFTIATVLCAFLADLREQKTPAERHIDIRTLMDALGLEPALMRALLKGSPNKIEDLVEVAHRAERPRHFWTIWLWYRPESKHAYFEALENLFNKFASQRHLLPLLPIVLQSPSDAEKAQVTTFLVIGAEGTLARLDNPESVETAEVIEAYAETALNTLASPMKPGRQMQIRYWYGRNLFDVDPNSIDPREPILGSLVNSTELARMRYDAPETRMLIDRILELWSTYIESERLADLPQPAEVVDEEGEKAVTRRMQEITTGSKSQSFLEPPPERPGRSGLSRQSQQDASQYMHFTLRSAGFPQDWSLLVAASFLEPGYVP